MEANKQKILMFALPLLVLLAFLILSPSLGSKNVNRAFALSAVVVLGATFILGPLGKFSSTANRLKIYRKYLGIAGVFLAVVHGLLSFSLFYGLDIGNLLSLDNPLLLQAYSAVIASLIFLLMTATSNTAAIRLLGPRRWKLVQNSGYLAMALVMLHFMLANTDNEVFRIGRIYALLAFTFGIIVIVVRALVLLLVAYEKSSKSK
jgi:DMSO/TMAO reductase YedYZ heme-binding membrane subunit